MLLFLFCSHLVQKAVYELTALRRAVELGDFYVLVESHVARDVAESGRLSDTEGDYRHIRSEEAVAVPVRHGLDDLVECGLIA